MSSCTCTKWYVYQLKESMRLIVALHMGCAFGIGYSSRLQGMANWLKCAQVGEIDMMWDSDGGNGASVPEHRSRVEREREIACYLLMVSRSESLPVRKQGSQQVVSVCQNSPACSMHNEHCVVMA